MEDKKTLEKLVDSFLVNDIDTREKLSWSDIIANISDIPILIICWKRLWNLDYAAEIIDARMVELLRKELPKMSVKDVPLLIFYLDSVFSFSDPGRLIEARILELLDEVVVDDIPDWFVTFLKNKESVLGTNGIKEFPDSLMSPFFKKAREIQKKLK